MNDNRLLIDEAKRRVEEFHAPVRRRFRFLTGLFLVLVLSIGISSFFIFQHTFERIGFGGMCFVMVVVFFVSCYGPLRLLLTSGNDLVRALEKQPETAQDHATRGRAFGDAEFYEEAIEDYQKALEMEPDNAEYLDDFVILLWDEMKDGDRALPYVERLCEIEGENQAEAFMFRGQILTKTDPDAALKSFDKAIELDPEDQFFTIAKARFFVDRDRLDEARRLVDEIYAMEKRSGSGTPAELYQVQGELAMKQNDPAAAVRFLSKAVRSEPSMAECYRLRGEAYDALGQYGKAEADRRQVEELATMVRD